MSEEQARTPDHQAFNWLRLERYVAGDCPPAEREATEQYLATHPDARHVVETFIAKLDPTNGEARDRDPQQFLATLHSKLQAHAAAPSDIRSVRSTSSHIQLARGKSTFWHWALAASLIVAVSLGALWRFSPSIFKHTASSEIAGRDYVTASGQRATVRLADGTEVMLNVASRLHIPADFGKTTRTVLLEGEARFVATHNPSRPFFVKTQRTITQDIGTVFGVRAYPGMSTTQIVVAEGSVAVRSASGSTFPSATLTAGDVAQVAGNGATRVERNAPVDRYLGWTENHLFFDQMPVREIAVQLGRWYNLDFRITDSTLAARRVTTSVRGEALTHEVLDDLAAALDARVEWNGRTVILSTRRNR